MGPIIVLLQVARDHPAETVAFTILFGWFWHSVVRLDHGRQRVLLASSFPLSLNKFHFFSV
jgi:hypothetical protein